MKNQKKEKLLIALDGSDQALKAARYVSEFTPFHKMKVVLFNVFSSVPESYRDLDKDSLFSKAAEEIMAWKMQRKKVIKESMDKAKLTLLRSGFSRHAVTVKIQNRKKGIARDIINEAKNGYSAVVIGRKGHANLKEIIVGSVAIKIIEKISFLPVLMIGEVSSEKNILLAMDGSENAMRAVDYVATILGGFDYKVKLFHVIRGGWKFVSGNPEILLTKPCLEDAEKGINVVLADAVSRLTDAGFKSNQISTKVISGVHSRAEAIVKEARNKKYGTIIVGRRGLSKVQEFFIGRVSNKVIHTTRKRAVWVVT